MGKVIEIMVKRRDFLAKSSVSVLSFGAVCAVAQQAPLNPVLPDPVKHGYLITNGPRARKKKDNLWKFTIRIINIDDAEHDISAFLQFATDRNFSQIVDQLPIGLKKDRSFIANTIYRSKLVNLKLFFRYVIFSDSRNIMPQGGIVGSISPWELESGVE
ncbi:hypothetical protein [Paraburkholderia humisilvae]|uniref:hypothetical protein n=1 Tax=Paraburkholderia humisilvae TaxID=627669 RepID=UPI001583C179|nr:hypothetical protein [Paraburkholderia humisilvae]